MHFKSIAVGRLESGAPIFYDGQMLYVKTKYGNMAVGEENIKVDLNKVRVPAPSTREEIWTKRH